MLLIFMMITWAEFYSDVPALPFMSLSLICWSI